LTIASLLSKFCEIYRSKLSNKSYILVVVTVVENLFSGEAEPEINIDSSPGSV